MAQNFSTNILRLSRQIVTCTGSNIYVNGLLFGTGIYSLVTDLNSSGILLYNDIISLSGYSNSTFATIGNLYTTGSNLYVNLTGLSGQFNINFAPANANYFYLTGNQIVTGNNTFTGNTSFVTPTLFSYSAVQPQTSATNKGIVDIQAVLANQGSGLPPSGLIVRRTNGQYLHIHEYDGSAHYIQGTGNKPIRIDSDLSAGNLLQITSSGSTTVALFDTVGNFFANGAITGNQGFYSGSTNIGNLFYPNTNPSGYITTGFLTGASGNLQSIIANTGQQAWNAANNNAINLSGNLTTTGINLYSDITGLSGVFNTTNAATYSSAISKSPDNFWYFTGNLAPAAFTNPPTFNSGDFSIFVTFNPTNLYTTGATPGQGLLGGLVNAFGLVVNSTGTIKATKAGVGDSVYTRSLLNNNQWYTVAYTRKSNLGSFYINGILDNSGVDSSFYSGASQFIGSWGIGSINNGPFTGFYKNLVIYSGTGLNATQVFDVSNYNTDPTLNPTIDYTAGITTGGNVWYDRSSNQNNASFNLNAANPYIFYNPLNELTGYINNNLAPANANLVYTTGIQIISGQKQFSGTSIFTSSVNLGYYDNSVVAFDANAANRVAFVKTAGFSPLLAYSSGTPFLISRLNTSGPVGLNAPTNSTTALTFDNSANVVAGIGLYVSGSAVLLQSQSGQFASYTQLYTTGQNSWNNDLNLSGTIALTGSNIYNIIVNESGALLAIIASTGQQAWLAAQNNAVNLSGNLTQTGINLYNLITQFSGASNLNFAPAAANYVYRSGTQNITGNKIFQQISFDTGIANVAIGYNNGSLITGLPFTLYGISNSGNFTGSGSALPNSIFGNYNYYNGTGNTYGNNIVGNLNNFYDAYGINNSNIFGNSNNIGLAYSASHNTPSLLTLLGNNNTIISTGLQGNAALRMGLFGDLNTISNYGNLAITYLYGFGNQFNFSSGASGATSSILNALFGNQNNININNYYTGSFGSGPTYEYNSIYGNNNILNSVSGDLFRQSIFGTSNTIGILNADNNIIIGTLNNVTGNLSSSNIIGYNNNITGGNNLIVLGNNINLNNSNSGLILGLGTTQIQLISGSGQYLSITGNYSPSGIASVAQILSLSGVDNTNIANTGSILYNDITSVSGWVKITTNYLPSVTINSNYTLSYPLPAVIYCNNTVPITINCTNPNAISGYYTTIKLINTGMVSMTGSLFDGNSVYNMLTQWTSQQFHSNGQAFYLI